MPRTYAGSSEVVRRLPADSAGQDAGYGSQDGRRYLHNSMTVAVACTESFPSGANLSSSRRRPEAPVELWNRSKFFRHRPA